MIERAVLSFALGNRIKPQHQPEIGDREVMAWWNQLEDNRGSRPRCVLLVDGNRKEVANRLTQLVGIRFAWSWKLVSFGIPVVLVYLGFLNAEDMKDQGKIFCSDANWENALRGYSEGVVDNTCWGEWMDFCGVPLLPLIRGYYQSFDGIIPECPPMD